MIGTRGKEHLFNSIFLMLWHPSAFKTDTLEIHFLCRGHDGTGLHFFLEAQHHLWHLMRMLQLPQQPQGCCGTAGVAVVQSTRTTD